MGNINTMLTVYVEDIKAILYALDEEQVHVAKEMLQDILEEFDSSYEEYEDE